MAICTHTHIHTGPSALLHPGQRAGRTGAPPSTPSCRSIATITPHGIITMATNHHIIMHPTLSNAHGSLFSGHSLLMFFFISISFFPEGIFLSLFPTVSFFFLLLLILISFKCISDLTFIPHILHILYNILNKDMKVEDRRVIQKGERDSKTKSRVCRWYRNLNFLIPTWG